jgi:hypothetical protein
MKLLRYVISSNIPSLHSIYIRTFSASSSKSLFLPQNESLSCAKQQVQLQFCIYIVTDVVFATQRLPKYMLHQMWALLLNG